MAPPPFDLPSLAGLLVEIDSGRSGAGLTSALSLVVDAQRRGEWAAWVAAGEGTFFPPDAAAAGADLDALPVVRVAGAPAGLRAADLLARSGAFGLVVLDLGADPRVPPAAVARLAGLARRHAAVVLCLAERPATAPSLGPLVAVRAEARRERVPGGGFRVLLHTTRDRRRGPRGPLPAEECDGPEGLP
jgi:recombination protein RecA